MKKTLSAIRALPGTYDGIEWRLSTGPGWARASSDTFAGPCGMRGFTLHVDDDGGISWTSATGRMTLLQGQPLGWVHLPTGRRVWLQ